MSYSEMSLNAYQVLAKRTMKPGTKSYDHDPVSASLVWNALGLAGESGEVVDLIKKQVCHEYGIDRDAIAKELGDVLWYLSAIASALGIELSDIAEANIDKLQERYPDGFSIFAGKNRKD